jgi:hypothetical protein
MKHFTIASALLLAIASSSWAAEASLETIKEDVQRMQGKLEDLKARAEQAQAAAKDLGARIKEKQEAIKALAENPAQISDETKRRAELLKSGDEARQLEALKGAEKLGDEGLLLCAHAIKDIDKEPVRRKALEIACAQGNDGLPVVAACYELLSAKDRLFLIGEIAKQKDKLDAFVFAQLAQDSEDENRLAALKAGLSKSDPLVFLVMAVGKNEEIGKAAFPLALNLKGDDLELFLFAFASKGPEELLPQIVKKAADLKDKGYPAIAAAYKRNVAEARAEIVRQFRKSEVPVEKRIIEEALRDEDATLRAAAEAAK